MSHLAKKALNELDKVALIIGRKNKKIHELKDTIERQAKMLRCQTLVTHNVRLRLSDAEDEIEELKYRKARK